MAKMRKSSVKKLKRNKARAKLNAAPREWEDIFHAIGQPTLILNPNFTIVACNKAIADLTGKPAEYFIGKKCCEMMHGKKTPPHDCPMEKLRKSHSFETSEMEVEVFGRTFLVSCTPVFDKSGKMLRIIHIATDITERRQMEQKIREGEESFRIMLENLPDGVFAHDLDGRIIQVNKMACMMTGYTSEELTSMMITDIEAAITRKEGEAIWRRLRKGDSFLLVNAIHRRKDGSRYPVEVRLNAIVLNNQPVILGLAQDVTDRKRDEEKMRIYREQLKSLSAELSYAEERERRRIATGIHDNIGQKLAIAKLDLQVLKGSLSEQSGLSVINDTCKTIEEIIDDTRSLIFDLSNPILYEIGLEEAVSNFIKDNFQNKSNLKCKLITGNGKISLDDDTNVVLFKAVRELLVNILKHAGAKNVKVVILKQDNEVEITVEDDGTGFQAEGLSLPSEKGGGFGLFNIRERLEYIGGHLMIKSSPGKGTCVTITAPLKKSELKKEKAKLYEDTHSR
jgi:PAS domain S-box-containing protein